MKRISIISGNWSRIRYGGVSTLLLILMIAVLIIVNVISKRLENTQGWRLDFSFNGITTQSETTLKTLNELDFPVHIYALFPKGEEDAPLMELLNRYTAVSSLVSWEQVDPAMNPALVTRFSTDTESVDSDSLIVYCETTGRWRILSPADFISLSLDEETGQYNYAGYTYEKALTNAIAYVSREKIPRVVILQGHGELDGETLSAFDALLTNHQYDVVYQNLSDTDFIPDPDDLLVFFSPLRDLDQAELEKVYTFASRGGSLLFTCDYSDPVDSMANYLALLRTYGFIPRNGIVVADREDPNSFYNNIRIDLIPVMISTDITKDLVASGADTLLLTGSRAFWSTEESDRNLLTFDVLKSGDTAYLKELSNDMKSLEKEEDDETGPFTLALEARRITESGYVSRAFIAGCSTLFTEEQIYAMTDSRQLIFRILEFLLNADPSGTDIIAKDAIRPALSAKSNGMGSLIITALPLSVLFVALLILIPRKNR